MYRGHYAWHLVLVATLLAIIGCGSNGPTLVAVNGTVLLDGEPVEGAAVMFMPQSSGRPATGVTDADGEFHLMTIAPKDGAQVGQHKVTVTLTKVTGFIADQDGLSGGVAREGLRQERIVPERYSNPETSGLTVEVKTGMEPVQLVLSSEPDSAN